jgi:hypothetical protein
MDALTALCGRRSVGPRQLVEPGPIQDDLQRMAESAVHAPDHAELVPFRFQGVRGEARIRLAEFFEQAALQRGKTADDAHIDAQRARTPPVTIALLARTDPGRPPQPAGCQSRGAGRDRRVVPTG